MRRVYGVEVEPAGVVRAAGPVVADRDDGRGERGDEPRVPEVLVCAVCGLLSAVVASCEFCQCAVPRSTVPFPMAPPGVSLGRHLSS